MDRGRDSYDFLKLFREDNEEVTLGLLHENPNIAPNDNFKGVRHLPITMEQLNKPIKDWVGYGYNSRFFINSHNCKLGKAVYFIVNPGGTKNKDITDVRAWFIDVDFAKIKLEFTDELQAQKKAQALKDDDKYDFVDIEASKKESTSSFYVIARHSQTYISNLKEQFIEKYRDLLKDSIIVETYAGYHCYWLAKNNSKIADFRKIQQLLIRKFDSDKQITNEARLMRLPGFYHQKYGEQFLVRVIQWSTKRFSEVELVNELHLNDKLPQSKGFEKNEIREKVSYLSDLYRTRTVIRPKDVKSDIEFKNIVPFNKVKRLTFNEAHDEVLKRPLSSFIDSPALNEGETVHCPFHDDNKASGIVYKSDLGQEVYYCHACGVGTRNVVGLYMLHTNKSWRKSIEELARVIGIKVVTTEFEQEQFEKYRDNRQYLEQDFETLFPYTAKWIEQYGRKSYLRYFNDKAETKVLKEEFQYKGHNVFFISYRAIAAEMRKNNVKSIQRNVIMLNLLGLIERVPVDEIPKELRIRAERERKILQQEFSEQGPKGKKRAEAVRLINFYIVRNWSDEAHQIEKMARKMKEKKFSLVKHANKIAIESIFGEEIAARVFPDGRKIPKRFNNVAVKLKKLVEEEIKENGFAIAEEIIRKRIRYKDSDGKIKTATLAQKQDACRRSILVSSDFSIEKTWSKYRKREVQFNKATPRTIHILTSSR